MRHLLAALSALIATGALAQGSQAFLNNTFSTNADTEVIPHLTVVESHTAVELDAGSASARRSLGIAYLYARRWDQAIYHFERGIARQDVLDQ